MLRGLLYDPVKGGAKNYSLRKEEPAGVGESCYQRIAERLKSSMSGNFFGVENSVVYYSDFSFGNEA